MIPDERHRLTRDDLTSGNVDLLNRAGELLAAMPQRALEVTVQSASDTQATLLVETQGITRLDVYVGDRPNQSIDLQASPTTLVVPKGTGTRTRIELRGFEADTLVARYRMSV